MDEPSIKLEYFVKIDWDDGETPISYEGKRHVYNQSRAYRRDFVGYDSVTELKEDSSYLGSGNSTTIVRRATMIIVSEFEDVE